MAVEAEAAAADGTVFCPRPSRRAMEKSFLGETSSQGGARSASKPRKIIFMRYFSEDGKTNVIVSMYKKGARYIASETGLSIPSVRYRLVELYYKGLGWL
jgi:hypothetical protein